MKYAIVIPDGCADEPQESLGDKTPLQAAHKPHMDFIAGHIASADGRALVAALQQALGGPVQVGDPPSTVATLEFHPGVSYRNILVYRSAEPAPFGGQTKTQPPHDIPDRPVADYLP